MLRLLPAFAFTLLLPAFACADEASDLRDRALKAFAKEPADLKKARTYTLKASGISNILGSAPTPASLEMASVWPGRFRGTWEFGVGEMKSRITMAGVDDRGWRKANAEAPVEFGVEEMNDFRADAYAYGVAMLLTLNEIEAKLSMGEASKVNDHPVLALKLTRRPWPEITLYFDEKTALLRKLSYRSREAGVTVSKEMVFDGHKEANGLMLPATQTTLVQGKEVVTWTSMTYAFPEKIEPKMFEKPEK